jgi:hypothetical protein
MLVVRPWYDALAIRFIMKGVMMSDDESLSSSSSNVSSLNLEDKAKSLVEILKPKFCDDPTTRPGGGVGAVIVLNSILTHASVSAAKRIKDDTRIKDTIKDDTRIKDTYDTLINILREDSTDPAIIYYLAEKLALAEHRSVQLSIMQDILNKCSLKALQKIFERCHFEKMSLKPETIQFLKEKKQACGFLEKKSEEDSPPRAQVPEKVLNNALDKLIAPTTGAAEAEIALGNASSSIKLPVSGTDVAKQIDAQWESGARRWYQSPQCAAFMSVCVGLGIGLYLGLDKVDVLHSEKYAAHGATLIAVLAAAFVACVSSIYVSHCKQSCLMSAKAEERRQHTVSIDSP